MRIDRCYCFQKTFAALKAVAEDEGARTVEELQRHVEFGQRCRLCHPYVRCMLRTGETVFDRILVDDEE